MNNMNKGSIAYLCFVWAFALLLGLSVAGFSWPLLLLVVGSILYLL